MLGSSLWLYRTSGAAQLDLSRPGYQPETEEPPEENPEAVPDKTFSGTGSLNTEAIEEFLDLYDKKAKSITNVDAFSLDTLSNESLGITE